MVDFNPSVGSSIGNNKNLPLPRGQNTFVHTNSLVSPEQINTGITPNPVEIVSNEVPVSVEKTLENNKLNLEGIAVSASLERPAQDPALLDFNPAIALSQERTIAKGADEIAADREVRVRTVADSNSPLSAADQEKLKADIAASRSSPIAVDSSSADDKPKAASTIVAEQMKRAQKIEGILKEAEAAEQRRSATIKQDVIVKGGAQGTLIDAT